MTCDNHCFYLFKLYSLTFIFIKENTGYMLRNLLQHPRNVAPCLIEYLILKSGSILTNVQQTKRSAAGREDAAGFSVAYCFGSRLKGLVLKLGRMRNLRFQREHQSSASEIEADFDSYDPLGSIKVSVGVLWLQKFV